MFCPECGTQLLDDSVFCENCGARLDGQPQMQPQSQVPPQQGESPFAVPPVQQQVPQQQAPDEYWAPAGAAQEPDFGSGNAGRSKLPLIIGGAVILAAVAAGAFLFLSKSGKIGKNAEDGAVIADDESSVAVYQEEPEPVAAEPVSGIEEPEPVSEIEEPEPEPASEIEEMVAASGIEEEEPAPEIEEPAEEQPAETEAAPPVASTVWEVSDVALDDFDWQEGSDFPANGTPLGGSDDLYGPWKGMVKVTTGAVGEEETRLMITKAELQYEEETAMLRQEVIQLYRYPADDPSELSEVDTTPGTMLNWSGSRNPATGTLDVSSSGTDLRARIMEFAEAGGKQYARGIIYSGKSPIGEILLMRP